MTSKLTREKAQWLHDACEEAADAGIKLTMNPNELLMFTSYALAAMDSEPVFFIEVEGDDWINAGRIPGSTFDFNNLPDGINNLYAAPQPAPVVPDEVDHVAAVLELIGSFEAADIDSDTIDLRFEIDDVDTGAEASITEYAARGAAIIRQLSGNSPVIPGGLIGAVNRLLDSDGSRGCYSAIRCGDAHDEIERLLAAVLQEVKGE